MKWLLVILKELIPVFVVIIIAGFSDFSLGKYLSRILGRELSLSEIRVIDMGLAAALCRITITAVQGLSHWIKSMVRQIFVDAKIDVIDKGTNSLDTVQLEQPGSSQVSRMKISIKIESKMNFQSMQKFILENTKILILWPHKWLSVECDQIDDIRYDIRDGNMIFNLSDLLSCRGGMATIDLAIQARHKSTTYDYVEIKLIYKNEKLKSFNRYIESLFINCSNKQCKLCLK